MKYVSIFVGIMLAVLSLSLTGCSGRDYIDWEGEAVTDTDPSTYRHEHWVVRLNMDGTCQAVVTVTGRAEYVDVCEGTWDPVTDDIAQLRMVAGERTSKVVTNSDLMKNNGKITYRTSHQVYNRYLRKDGAFSPFVDYMDQAKIWLKRK
ncbi:MAG: hypothetical protein HDS64_11425 [Bacteroidales bacterium]|nr:hypothetical protein [Bacteroidales bacterium]